MVSGGRTEAGRNFSLCVTKLAIWENPGKLWKNARGRTGPRWVDLHLEWCMDEGRLEVSDVGGWKKREIEEMMGQVTGGSIW